MSILIKGMEMPKYESLTIKIMPSGAVRDQYGRLDERVKAVEVPKHGRLIEADEAIGKIVHGEYVTMVDKYGNSWMMPGKAIEIIADAPTIIEAEGRENE